MLAALPLLVIVVLAYNVLAFTAPASIGQAVWSGHLASGADFTATVGDMLIGLGVLLLYFEILKATRFSARSMANQFLSMALFVVALVQFLLLPQFGTSTFFIIMLVCFVDVVAGFTVAVATAKRDISLGNAN